MDDVTDTVFRQVILKTCQPDIFYTEFTNCEGLFSAGSEKIMQRLKFAKEEKPIVAQLWGINPDNFEKAARFCKKLGFDGIDINMGCPDKKAVKKGACAALIQNHNLAQKIIKAVKKGVPNLPISVKTRIGLDKIITEEWIGFLLKQNLYAITVHGRTARELSKVPCHWDEIAKSVKIRNKMGSKTLIFGNGDVEDKIQGLKFCKKYGVDGVMIGRGIFKNLWAFSDKEHKATLQEMLELLLFHARLFNKTWLGTKNFNILKKFFKCYTLGYRNASKLRKKLMETSSVKEVEKIISTL